MVDISFWMFARSFQVVVTTDMPFGDMVLTLKGNCEVGDGAAVLLWLGEYSLDWI
jgi:hypothetical protein